MKKRPFIYTALFISAAVHAALLSPVVSLLGFRFTYPKHIAMPAAVEKTDEMKVLPEIRVRAEVTRVKKSVNDSVRQDASGLQAAAADAEAAENAMRYEDMIKQKLQANRRYPYMARRRGTEGRVGVNFSIDRNGKVTALDITSGSGSDELDRDAKETVMRSQPFPAMPDGLGESMGIRVVIVYTLK